MSLTKQLRLLLIEDSEDDAFLVIRELRHAGFDVQSRRVETEETVLAALRESEWDVVISDFNMPHLTGLRALELVSATNPGLPFILVSGSVGERLAVQAMKAGAHDYLMKDSLTRLGAAVEREIKEDHERRKRREAEASLEDKNRQLVTAQRMESVGRLAGGIAHDLNNVIGACMIYGEIALDPTQDIDSVRESVRQIVKAQERATQLVRQLLAFSRKQVIDPQIITLNHVISEIREMLTQILGEDIELAADLDPSLQPIKADPAQIDQVLMNLVVNARDAMPKGGKLFIKTWNEKIQGDSPLLGQSTDLVPGDYAVLSVQDSGIGMDEGIKSRIFEPFFTTKEVGKGNGLGLSTVYGIVKQAHGEIRVESAPDKGTTFRLYFKSTSDMAVPAKHPPAPKAKPIVTQQRTLLLVEDDFALRDALRRTFSRAGYRLYISKNGEEGFHEFESHQAEIDLIVSDVVMPKLSGPDMADRLRKKNPDLKVLFLSGYAADTLLSYGIDHQRTFVLAKPFTVAQVTEKVDDILRNSDHE